MSNINHTKRKCQNIIEVLISMALIDSCVSQDEFVLVNVLKRIWWYERRNLESKGLKNLSNILIYL